MEFVLAVDPEVKGQVGLTRKGRLELLLPSAHSDADDAEYASSTAASQSSHPSDNLTLYKESDSASQAATSQISLKVGTCAELVATNSKHDNRDPCNSNETNVYQQQQPIQMNSSQTNVRDLHKYLNPDLHHTDATQPPLDDVFVCKDLMKPSSWDGACDIEDLLSLNQLRTAPTHLDSEIAVKEQSWLCLLDSWRREKYEMTAAINALKNENKQLQNSLDHMKKWLEKSSEHEAQKNNGVTNEHLTDSQELYKETIHKQGSSILSQQDDTKCVSTEQHKGMEGVVTLLQQQVKVLELEKEANKAMHENELDILQQEIKSLQQSHSVTMFKLVKMALERERENGRTHLGRFDEIEQESRSHVTEIGKKFSDFSHLETKEEEMTNDEVFELKYKYSVQESELDELRAKLAKEERRKEKRRSKRKKKETIEKKLERRKSMNDRSDEPLSIAEVGDVAFVKLELDDDSLITVSRTGAEV
jgi:hypothetical protein